MVRDEEMKEWTDAMDVAKSFVEHYDGFQIEDC